MPYSYFLLYLYLVLYLSVLIMTYLRLQDEASKVVWVGTFLSLIAVFITPIALLLALEPNRPIEILLFGFIFPLFIIGLGLALGGWTKKHRLNKMTTLSYYILGAFIFLPVSGLAYLNISSIVKDNTRSTAIYNYQSLTVSDRLGSNDLNIPISPQLKLLHYCPSSIKPYRNYQACKDRKYGKFYLIDFIIFFTKNLSYRDRRAQRLKRC